LFARAGPAERNALHATCEAGRPTRQWSANACPSVTGAGPGFIGFRTPSKRLGAATATRAPVIDAFPTTTSYPGAVNRADLARRAPPRACTGFRTGLEGRTIGRPATRRSAACSMSASTWSATSPRLAVRWRRSLAEPAWRYRCAPTSRAHRLVIHRSMDGRAGRFPAPAGGSLFVELGVRPPTRAPDLLEVAAVSRRTTRASRAPAVDTVTRSDNAY